MGAWDGLRYFIVALPEPSYNYFGFGGAEKGNIFLVLC